MSNSRSFRAATALWLSLFLMVSTNMLALPAGAQTDETQEKAGQMYDAYNNGKKQIDKAVDDAKTDLGKATTAGERQKAYDKLLIDLPKKVNETVQMLDPKLAEGLVAAMLTKIAGVVPNEQWCALLKKYRGPGGTYKDSPSSFWTEVGGLEAKLCPKNKAAAPAPKTETGGGIKCPYGLPTIEDCVNTEGMTIDLYGDGTTTSHCTLVMTDKKTGVSSETELNTVCISTKTSKAPPPKEVAQKQHLHYQLAPAPTSAISTVQAASELSSQGKFDNVSIPISRRLSTITQLAIWEKLGGTDPSSSNAICPKNVKSDLLTNAHVDPTSLTEDENKRLNDKVDQICSSVDLTCKYSETYTPKKPTRPRIPDIPVIPGQPEIPDHPGIPENPGTPDHPGIPTEVCVPTYTTFRPNREEFQTMMCVDDAKINCPNGGTTVVPTTPGIIEVADKPCNWHMQAVLYLERVSKKEEKDATKEAARQTAKSEQDSALGAEIGELEKAKLPAKDRADKQGLSKVQPPSWQKDYDVFVFYVCIANDGSVQDVQYEELTGKDLKPFTTDPLPETNANKRGIERKKEFDKNQGDREKTLRDINDKWTSAHASM